MRTYFPPVTSITPFTSEIASRRYLEVGATASYILWAEEMLLAGFDSPTLRILSGELEPYNTFEITQLFDLTSKELKLPKLNSETEAVVTFATALVRNFLEQLATSADTLFWLTELDGFYNVGAELFEFFELHRAACDLEAGYPTMYWPNATSKNIEKIILHQSKLWCAKHRLEKWEELEWK